MSIDELLKLDYWVHIKPEILKQGRVCYFDGSILAKNHVDNNDESSIDLDDGDDDDDDPKEHKLDTMNIKMNQETGVPLFTSCSSDRLTNDIISPWTISLNDVIVESPLVLLQSNIWSGAFTFVKDR